MAEEVSGRAGVSREFKRDRLDDRADDMAGFPQILGVSGPSGEFPARLEPLSTICSSSLGLNWQSGFSAAPCNQQQEGSDWHCRESGQSINGMTDAGVYSNRISDHLNSRFVLAQGAGDRAVGELMMTRIAFVTDGYVEEDNEASRFDQSAQMDDRDLNLFLNRGLQAGLDDMESSCESAGHDNQCVRRMETGSELQWSFEDLKEMMEPSVDGARINPEVDCEHQGHQCQPFPPVGLQHPQGSTVIHHKRPKVLSFLSRSQASCAGSSQGISSSAPLNLGQSSPAPEGDDQGGSSPSSPWQNDGQEPMDSDNGGEEEGDDSNGNGEDDSTGSRMEDDMPPMDLTDDLLHMVFSFLNQASLCQAARVCRQWRTASGHEDFWKSLDFEGRKISKDQVGSLCRRYPRAVDLNLKDVPCIDDVAREAMHWLRGLEKLTLGKGNLSDSFFNALATECLALEHLTITDAVLGSGGAQEIQVRHESLRRLQVTKCRVMRMAIRCPLLDTLSLKRTSMASAMLHCPRLLGLDVSSCHKLSDAGVRAAATACPSLLSLDISQCSYVSDETLREISVACSSLHVLDASYCPNISLEGVRMSMLTELKLHNCEGINSSSMAALSHCFMLETIQLDFCALLTAVVLDLPRLQSISLVNCRKFVELTLRCPALVNINVATCPVLNRVDIESTALQKLILQKQQSLTTMALQCPRLREVDLTECDSLTNSICEVFSEGGGCPGLNSLILDNCESLTMVKLSSTSLKLLSLAGCRKICSIELACPNLQQLYLDGCDHLTTATFAPVGLQSLNLGICPHVTKLRIEAPYMTSLDLKGCGVLCQAIIHCPQLLSLDAFYCSKLEDECLEATATACPLIQSLILASCPSVGPAGLSALKKLSNLTTLDLSYTFLTDLTPIFETCPQLKVLRLLACKYLVDTALDSLHGKKTLPELRELDLSYGSLGQAALEGLLSQCPHLTHVSLNGCVNLYDLDWEISSEFFVVKGQSFGDGSMEDILGLQATNQVPQEYQPGDGSLPSSELSEIGVTTSDSEFQFDILGTAENHDSFYRDATDGLECFSKSEQAAIEEMGGGVQELEVISARALQHLNCVGCPNIKKVVIPFNAGFPHLSSLNLSLSNNIKEVRLECINLMSLNLSNCSALEELKLLCPRLVSLSLQASGIEATELEGALTGCGSLETLDIRNCPKISVDALSRMRAACPRLKRLVNTISA